MVLATPVLSDPTRDDMLHPSEKDVVWVPRNLDPNQPWRIEPLITNPYGICLALAYVMTFAMLAFIIQACSGQIVELRVEYRSDPGCVAGKGGSKNVSAATRFAEVYQCFNYTMPDGDPVFVEKFIVTIAEDMDGPLNVYYEVDGMYQNHFWYVKSTQTSVPMNQMLYGSYTGEANTWQFGKKRHGGDEWEEEAHRDIGIYNYWHPVLMTPKGTGGAGQGCLPRWSTEDLKCLADGGDDTGHCATGPKLVTDETTKRTWVSGNRAIYPCGIGFGTVMTDTFAVIPHTNLEVADPPLAAIRNSPQDISYTYDYKYRYRNLNPEAAFDSSKAADVSVDGGQLKASLNGRKFSEVYSFWMLKFFPPALCADDPLKLLQPKSLPDYPETADCQNYAGYDPDPSANTATCTYENPHNFVNPINGQRIACARQYPNPAGWNVENSLAMNWVRVAAETRFWKLAAKIDETWKKGDKKVVYIANRWKVGPEWPGKKALVFTSQKRMWSGNSQGGEMLANVFFIVGLLAFFFQHRGAAPKRHPKRTPRQNQVFALERPSRRNRELI